MTKFECDVFELTTNSYYNFRVTAVNKFGPGEPVETSEAVLIKPSYGEIFV